MFDVVLDGWRDEHTNGTGCFQYFKRTNFLSAKMIQTINVRVVKLINFSRFFFVNLENPHLII